MSTCTSCGTPACFDQYGELLSRSYTVDAYRPVHQLVVDSYIAQHPGGTTRREIQAVAVCLMTLCLFLENSADPRQGPALHKRMVANRPDFQWLEPPPLRDLTTVADVLAATDAAHHTKLVWAWASDVWQAWSPHHATIRTWNAQAL